jgi:Sigma-70 factor, region 1.1
MSSERLQMYLSAATTRQFIEFAKNRGYATRDELRLYLPMNVTADEMEEVASLLAETGIAVIGKSEAPQEGAGLVTQLRELVRRNAMPPVPAEKEPFTPSRNMTSGPACAA